MHHPAYDFVRKNLPFPVYAQINVVEVGSLNINGTVRDLLPAANWYGIDITDGPDVDEVADGTTFKPDWPVDLAICCEVFEHTPDWASIIMNMASWLDMGGVMILTAAGPSRPQHSAIDGGPLRSGEWYENIEPNRLSAVLVEAGIRYTIRVAGQDIYAVGTKL